MIHPFRVALFTLLAGSLLASARADVVWSSGQVPGDGWALQMDPSSLNLSASGSSDGVSGSARGAAALDGGEYGYLRAAVASTATPTYVGTSTARVGLSADVLLSGPQDVAGVAAITMTFDGTYGGPGANQSYFLLQSGRGLQDGSGLIGFAVLDDSLRGLFSLTDNVLYGRSVDGCTNCSYSVGDDFLISITTFLPFDAGASSVRYAAQIEIETQGAFIDGFNTATFSIALPEGFTYTSALTFVEPVTSIPEPASLWLMALGLTALFAGRRFGTGRRSP